MSKCHFCGEEYKGYVVLLNSDLECLAMDIYIRDIYYDEESDEGVCEPCRDKEFSKPIWKIQSWFPVKLNLMLVEQNLKSNNDKRAIKYTEAIKRVEKIESDLEKLPEIQAFYKKNNPAYGLEPLKEKTMCIYCGENHGQKWIPNPNSEDIQKSLEEKNVWWVCIPCEKIIDLQGQDSVVGNFQHMMEKEGRTDLVEKIKKDREKIQKKI